MKYLFLVTLLSFNVFASASQLEYFFNSPQANNLCQDAVTISGQTVRSNLKFIKGTENEAFFFFKFGHINKLVRYDLLTYQRSDLFLERPINDLLILEKEVLLLTDTEILLADRITGRLLMRTPSQPRHFQYSKNAIATEIKQHNGKLYIAHGLNGVMVYNYYSMSFEGNINPKVKQPQNFHKSAITGVEVNGNELYLSYDDVTLVHDSKAYEGLVIYNLDTRQKVREIPVNQRKEAYYKPRLQFDRGELLVTNLNYIFRHRITDLSSDRYMIPFQRVWKYPAGEVVGRSLIKNGNVYGCFVDHSRNIIQSDGHFLK